MIAAGAVAERKRYGSRRSGAGCSLLLRTCDLRGRRGGWHAREPRVDSSIWPCAGPPLDLQRLRLAKDRVVTIPRVGMVAQPLRRGAEQVGLALVLAAVLQEVDPEAPCLRIT